MSRDAVVALGLHTSTMTYLDPIDPKHEVNTFVDKITRNFLATLKPA